MKIFISYRRDDTAGRAGRLFDLLATRFGARNVFQDVTAIEPGTDFTKRVDEAIAQCDATLVVIGSDWLSNERTDGTRRLDEPDDYVRREVGAALAVGGDNGDNDAESPPDRLTECPVPDTSWAPIEVRDGATGYSTHGLVVGDEFQIEPGQRADALVGYLTSEVVDGARLVVETDGDQEIEFTPAG